MASAARRRRETEIVPLELFPMESSVLPGALPLPGDPPLDFKDPAFASNKTLPIHRWVPWIAGFASGFVRDALAKYLLQPGVVLDPFAGVGTTLVEAMLAGHDAVGFEINPYAALASQVKTSLAKLPLAEVRTAVHEFVAFYQNAIATEYQPQSSSPSGFTSRVPFYSPLVLRKVLIVQDFIVTRDVPAIQRLFQLAFAATMVSYSNYSYEPSLGRRVSSGKADILDFPVMDAIVAKLHEYCADIAWYQAHQPHFAAQARIIPSSFFDYQHHLAPASVDCIVTSPPYLNNYHYNRNTRPHLYWLGFANQPRDLRALEEANFGKYWQTVRDQPALPLSFSLPHSDLAERIAELRECNTARGIYGGNGWANYATTYFNDCYRLAEGMAYALKSGSRALVVIGNSILQGVFIPTDVYLGQIAEAVGLERVGISVPRATRVGNSITKSTVRVGKAAEGHRLYEAVVELRKP
jgi:hypothetical protein